MGEWQGLFWGEDFARRIRTETFWVHSVFHRVINLQADPAKPLLSLVIQREALGPNALFLSGEGGWGDSLVGLPVNFAAGHLVGGAMHIACSAASIYDPKPILDQQQQGALKRVREWVEMRSTGLASVRSQITERLAQGLLREDEGLVRSAFSGFIGQGEGLTPAGDDFIAGVLLAFVKGFQHQDLSNTFISRLPVLVEEVWWRTTAVSQTMLWYAARGEGANYLTEMVEGLYHESGQVLELAARLWQVGASSGRYLLAGVLLGSELFQTREGERSACKKKLSYDPIRMPIL